MSAASARLEALAPGLYRFDTHCIRPRHSACSVLVDDGCATIVDCGVAANVAPLLAALESLDLGRDAVDAVIVTHAHLDQAGGAAPLMQALPRARLYAHPSAGRHRVDPARLDRGVRAVCGDAFFEREYGTLVSAPAGRARHPAGPVHPACTLPRRREGD